MLLGGASTQPYIQECTNYLGPNGIDAVQISPVTEHILGSDIWSAQFGIGLELRGLKVWGLGVKGFKGLRV